MDRTDILDILVKEASRAAVTVHTHPDGDAVGSGLALLGYLTVCRGTDAVLIVPDPIPESLSFMTGWIPPKGRVITFSEDPDLASSIVKDRDLIFCLDCNTFSRTNPALETVLKGSAARKVLIDHHLNPDSSAFDAVFSDTGVSSTCELLFRILRRMPDLGGDIKNLPPEALSCLMTGMTTDTNNFANSVYPLTLQMASELIAAGVDRDWILQRLYNSYRENRLRLMGYLLGQNLKITPDGLAIMILDRQTQLRFDFRQGESEGFVNMPLAAASVRMSVMLTEEEDHFRVSVRSKRGTSANKFAANYFHGGGHENAAGGRLFFPQDIPAPKDAEAYILKVAGEFFL